MSVVFSVSQLQTMLRCTFNPGLGFVLEDRLPEGGVLGLEGFKAAAGPSGFPRRAVPTGAPRLLHVHACPGCALSSALSSPLSIRVSSVFLRLVATISLSSFMRGF